MFYGDEKKRRRKKTREEVVKEIFLGDRLSQLSDALLELSASMEKAGDIADSGPEAGDTMWRTRFAESRNALAAGFQETAFILERVVHEYIQAEDVTGDWERRLRQALRNHHICLEEVSVLRHQEGRLELYAKVRTGGRRCMTAKEFIEIINREMGRRFKAADDSQRIVGKKTSELHLMQDTDYHMLYGVARQVKENEEVSGDNFSCMRLPDGRALLGLSDGMGSGRDACEDSEAAMELAEKLLSAGFTEDKVARLINAVLLSRGNEQNPATLDLATVDLYTGDCRFTKLGAVTTFLRRDRCVEMIASESLPAGILPDARPAHSSCHLKNGDMIVMVTDGILDALNGVDKEETMREILSCIPSDNPKEIAGKVIEYARMDRLEAADDMTVLAAGIWQK